MAEPILTGLISGVALPLIKAFIMSRNKRLNDDYALKTKALNREEEIVKTALKNQSNATIDATLNVAKTPEAKEEEDKAAAETPKDKEGEDEATVEVPEARKETSRATTEATLSDIQRARNHDSAKYVGALNKTDPWYTWLSFTIVDTVRGLVRPIVTFTLVGITGLLFYKGYMPTNDYLDMPDNALITLTSLVIAFWFGDRVVNNISQENRPSS